MNQETISDALNLLSDDIIGETDGLRQKKRTRSRGKKLAVAACAALVLLAGIRMLPRQAPETLPELPKLSITYDKNGGMGYEGYMAFDISELVSGNPWEETAKSSTLPVYRNKLAVDEHFQVSGADSGKMRELLLEIAGKLGLDTNSLTIQDDGFGDGTQKGISEEMVIRTEGVEIRVNQALTATVIFDPAAALPDGYNFHTYASYADMEQVAQYLRGAYRDLIGMEDPRVSMDGGDYDIFLRQAYQIAFFDASGEKASQIVNYNLNWVRFSCDDAGKLWMIRINRPDLSEKMGDYPIITVDQAEALLETGSYITNVPYEMPGMEYVEKVELVYRTEIREEYFMPYYRFYVELPQEARENGLKVYGAYYVPAVEAEYISNMPVWDGGFN